MLFLPFAEFPSSRSQTSPGQKPCQPVCLAKLSSSSELLAQNTNPVFLVLPHCQLQTRGEAKDLLCQFPSCRHSLPHRQATHLLSLLSRSLTCARALIHSSVFRGAVDKRGIIASLTVSYSACHVLLFNKLTLTTFCNGLRWWSLASTSLFALRHKRKCCAGEV